MRVAAGGGEAQPLIGPDHKSNYAFVYPSFLPGARELLFSIWGKDLGLVRLDIAKLERKSIIGGSYCNAAYAKSGHFIVSARAERCEIEAIPDSIRGGESRPVPQLVQRHVFHNYRMGRGRTTGL